MSWPVFAILLLAAGVAAALAALVAAAARREARLARQAAQEARRAADRGATAPPAPPPTPGPDSEEVVEVAAAAARREQSPRFLAVEEALQRLETTIRELERRLDVTIGRLDALEATPPPAPKPTEEAPPEPADRIHEHLSAQGYDRVVVLGPDGDDLRVEAERGGITEKGLARVHDDGRVEVRLAPALRVFP